jgi:hypothetical protein
MRRDHLVVFSSILLTLLFVPAPLLRAQTQTQAQDPDSEQSPEKHEGTAPRASAARYPAHGERDGLSIGAEKLTKKQVADVFAAEVNRCCVVVHVAVYPKKGEVTELSLTDFALVEVQTDSPLRPESPTVVAAMVEKKRNPGGGVNVTPGASIGYANGTYTDASGQPVHVHGVSTGVGVGVSTRGSVPATVADREREAMERELFEKGLPEAKVSVPVAGYLYFPIPKPKIGAKYRLVFSGKSEPLVVPLP